MEEWERNTRRYVWEEERTPNSVQKLRNKFNGGRGKDVGEIFEWKVCFTYYGAKSGPLFKRRIIPRINSRRGKSRRGAVPRSRVPLIIIIIIIQPPLTASNLPAESQGNNPVPPSVENSVGRRPTFHFAGNLSFPNRRETEKKYHGRTFSASRNFGKRERGKKKRYIYIPTTRINIYFARILRGKRDI